MDTEIEINLARHLSRPAWKDVAFGSAAGMVAKCFEHPFDLIKVRLQSQPWSANNTPLHFTGPLDCFLQTFKKEGLRGLYRGLSMPVGGAMAENATLFVTYNQIQQLLARHFPYKGRDAPVSHLAVAGAGAGVAVSFVLTPIELVKCRMQVQMISPQFSSIQKPPGPVHIASQIIQEGGYKGLWLGQTGTFLREAGGSVAWFLVYELAARRMARSISPTATKSDLAVWQSMAAGAAAGVGYTVVLFPADTIKSTLQTARELEGPASRTARLGFINIGKQIYQTKGLKGLYSGCGVTCIRSSGSSAIIFTIYSFLENHFG